MVSVVPINPRQLTSGNTFTGDLRLKSLLFREANINPEGIIAQLVKRIFCVFVLPLMLAHGLWSLKDQERAWFSHLIADILVSRTIRHVLRVHDARATLFPEEHRVFGRKFRFTDNTDLVGDPEPL